MTPIRFRIFRFRFESGAGFVLFVAAMLALMIGAGFWQLDRARQKTAMMQSVENAAETDAVTVIAGLPTPELIRYRTVRLIGAYLADRQLLLDNRVYAGEHGERRIGYEVLTPFRMADGAVLLVNRGWVAGGDDRRVLPQIDVDPREREIKGLFDMPGKSFSLGAVDADDTWPRVIQYIDYDALAQRLDIPVLYPAVLILAPGEESGFQYHWRPVVDGPLKHYSYAAQWFLMSLATIILFLVFVRRKEYDE